MECDNCGKDTAALEQVPASNFKRNRGGAAAGSIGVCDLCYGQFRLREEAVARVVDSGSPKKLIVAGPGTGKTHPFRKLVESLREIALLKFIPPETVRNEFATLLLPLAGNGHRI